MILVYKDLFDGGKKKRIKAKISYEHSSCSYGLPVVVLPDGGSLDAVSWVCLGYEVVKSTQAENKALCQLGLI